MPIESREQRIRTVCLFVLAVIAVGASLQALRDVLVPFVLAVLLSIILAPVVDWLGDRLRVPRGASTTLVLLIATFLLVATGSFVTDSLDGIDADWPRYRTALEELLHRCGVDDPPDFLSSYILPTSEDVPAVLSALTSALLSLISDGAMVLLYLVFLLVGDQRMAEGTTWIAIRTSIRRYIGLKVLISLSTAIGVGLILGLLGMKLAPVFALFVFLLNFVPNVGPPLATLLPLPIVLVSPDLSTTESVLAIALPAAIQVVLGNILEPRLMGRSLDLHPVTVLLALILWGTLWGVVGVFLAVPLAAAIRVVLAEFEYTENLAEVMSGRARFDVNSGQPAGR